MDWTRFLKDIASPTVSHRAAPFYSWNATLESDELRRQMRIMHEMGLGGAFMHSRVGLGTPYLSDEWFDRIDACVDEARKLGMQAWLYDEDRWPSGAAGGIVTKDERWRIRALCVEEVAEAPEGRQNVAEFAIIFDEAGKKLRSYRRIGGKDEVRDGEVYKLFYRHISLPSPWFNGQTYLDTLNPEAVAEFIRVTHEAYKRMDKGDFGKTVPGIFTDEPHCGAWRNGVSWTDNFPEYFRNRFGYDLLDHLPELFWQKEDAMFSGVRRDYRDMQTELFAVSFNKQIGEWCKENGLIYTGHMLHEDKLTAQTVHSGNVMRSYEYMQQPGIDLLTEHWMVFNTAKQCSSVAHQFGCPRRLTETYGCTGWDFPFFAHKALSDWQFALGINMRVPHLSWYSMEGQAKRDYPASILHQSPWYKNYKDVEDVLARTSEALSEGEEQRDLLVIFPVESFWGIFTPCTKELMDMEPIYQEWDTNFIQLTFSLLGAHLDFDLGEEDIMARHGSVSNGMISVAKAAYNTVLIPELLTIRKTTLDLLSAFAEQGGKVVYLGEPPAYVDGKVSGEAAAVYQKFQSAARENMTEYLESARRVSVQTGGSEIRQALYLLQKHDRGQTLFICNLGTDPALHTYCVSPPCRDRHDAFPEVDVTLKNIPADTRLYELDLQTAKLTLLPCTNNGDLTFKTSLAELQSRMFFLTADELPAEKLVPCCCGKTVAIAPENWQFELDDPNVLVLDRIRYSMDGGPFHADYILSADKKIRQALGAPARGGQMVQPWVSRDKTEPGKQTDLILLANFFCNDVPAGVELAMEHPEWFRIYLNGTLIEQPAESGWWVDRCTRRIPLPDDAFRPGENVLELRGRYHKDLSGLEAMFLLGDFSVKDEKIGKPVTSLSTGSIVDQGFPCYSGNIIYKTEVTLDAEPACCRLRFGEWRGVSLAVRINGGDWIPTPFPPFTADLTGLMKAGVNTVELRVNGSRRNAFGPFYADSVTPDYCGAWYLEMDEHPDRWLVPFGLLTSPELVIA